MLISAIPASSRLSEVEVSSGIVRRTREGAFTTRRRNRMLAALQRDLPALAIVEMIPEITADARALLLRHPLRAGDAIQLASCAYLQRQLGQAVPFVAFDRRLLAAAQPRARLSSRLRATNGRSRKTCGRRAGRHGKVGSRRVRHDETRCTGAERNGANRTERTPTKTTGNHADRSVRTSMIRSLDHGIGVRIPA